MLWIRKAADSYDSHIDVGQVNRYVVSGLVDGGDYCFAVQAYNISRDTSERSKEVCTTIGSPPDDNPPPDEIDANDIVLYALKATLVRGNWAAATSPGAAGGRAMRSTDRGWSSTDTPLAAPAHYFEHTFSAVAGTPYQIWLRVRAAANSKWNDSAWVQFSHSLVGNAAKYRIGSTSALLVNLERCHACGAMDWGWVNTAYWLSQPTTLTFSTSGPQTIRVQTREDGLEIDQIVLSPAKFVATAPGAATNDRTILAESPVSRSTGSDIVLYAAEAIAISGNWSAVASSSAAGGNTIRSIDRGWSKTDAPSTMPAHFVDVSFKANANTPYRVWMRLRAASNSKWNDSVWVQFSDSLVRGAAKYRIGTSSALLINLERCAGCGTAGWGWHNGAYWLAQDTTVTFAQSGPHTLRVQIREDGVDVDQIVLSPVTFAARAPGSIANDTTTLAKTPVTPPASRLPFNGVPLALPGTIEATHFDYGPAGVAYRDSTAGNTGGRFRSGDVDVELAADGGYNIGWSAPGEWLTYSVKAATTGKYTLSLKVASLAGGTLQITSGTPSHAAVNVSVPKTGGWQNWTTVSVPLALSAGEQVLTVTFLTGGTNLRALVVK